MYKLSLFVGSTLAVALALLWYGYYTDVELFTTWYYTYPFAYKTLLVVSVVWVLVSILVTIVSYICFCGYWYKLLIYLFCPSTTVGTFLAMCASTVLYRTEHMPMSDVVVGTIFGFLLLTLSFMSFTRAYKQT